MRITVKGLCQCQLVQEKDRQLSAQRERLAVLEEQNAALEARLAALERRLLEGLRAAVLAGLVS